jgi:uncharacterized protein YgiM (DUF1202 family)
MSYPIQSGIHVSLNNSTWYKLTDHNRAEITITPELIQNESRMANGTLKKYVVAQKDKISTSWSFVPSKTSECVDGNKSAAWLESFYKANVGIPIYIKVIVSEITTGTARGSVPDDFYFKSAQEGSKEYTVFISNFSKRVLKRTKVSDYVSMDIEFTEI